jgi:hypothetical protein
MMGDHLEARWAKVCVRRWRGRSLPRRNDFESAVKTLG